MSIRILFFCPLVAVMTQGKAQSQGVVTQLSPPARNLPVSAVRVVTVLDLFNNPLGSEKINGSPYLDTTFIKGTVETSKGRFRGLPMRYDIYFDQVEIKDGDSIFTLLPDTSIRKLELGRITLVVENVEVDRKTQASYFSRLETGNLSLYAKMVVIIIPGREPGPMQTEGGPARYERGKDIYFCRIGNGKLAPVRQIKTLIALLPDHRDEMERFARGVGKGANKKDEFQRFVKRYNMVSGVVPQK